MNKIKISQSDSNLDIDTPTDTPIDTPKIALIIGYVWPEPNSSAAGTRMMQLIQVLQNDDWQITFASPANLGEHKQNLESLGIKEQNIELNDCRFDRFIEELQPGLVIFDRFMMEEQFGWRVEQYAPKAVRILNTEDLHSLRACRENLLKAHLKTNLKNQSKELDLTNLQLTNQAYLFKNMATTDLAKREMAAIFRCDLTLMISEFEIELLQQQFKIPKSQLHYLPFLYQPVENTLLPSFEQRQHFVTIGNFRHQPNWDAVLWLKEAIWPLIRQQLPQAELHIYGAYPPPKATALHNHKQGFLVKGWAKDAYEVIANAKVLLAPLRFGAGIKGKLAEAMLNGTPSVTTLIGSESMLSQNIEHWPGAIANNASDFANAAVTLYQDDQAWQKHQTYGFKNALQRYVNNKDLHNHNNFEYTLINQINYIKNNINQHRAQNFMGSMLNHHHHKSTKYMAQWIEAKNRNQEDKS
ncbi:glycosyltransferase family 4 protein [Thiomicrorhabdus hydrogeniphila]